MNEKIFPKRRIFINNGKNHYQIFKFNQDKDGTIYCSSPDFADAKWTSYSLTETDLKLLTSEAIGNGKISFHGSGVTAIRSNNNPEGHTLRIKGNNLVNLEQKSSGARHLFTAFLKEPKHFSTNSPAFNRESDYIMHADVKLEPFVLIFFAVPQLGISINFEFNLHMDEMKNIPNDFLGGHTIPLRYHDVFWFAYRTKNMDKWPKYTHYSYHDGYTVPIFIGTGPQKFRLEFRQPTYSLNGKDFTIQCTRVYDS